MLKNYKRFSKSKCTQNNLIVFRCPCLGAVLCVALALGRPDVLESRAAALTVCPVRTERSVTTLVLDTFYNLIYKNKSKVKI